MQVWRNSPRFEKQLHGGSLTIGNFDGLHLGHQSLLNEMRRRPGPHVVLTFDPHPLQVLQPERGLRRLFPREDLVEQCPRYGVDHLVILKFDHALSQLSAQDFLRTHVFHALAPGHIVVGYDFAFGRDRGGDLVLLQTECAARGVELVTMPQITRAEKTISSRALREMVVAGKVDVAQSWLGRPFYLRGHLVSGAGRGRQIGVPTLNQAVINETLPATGVYASRTRIGGRIWDSVTNVGTNPTFTPDQKIKVETHVLGEVVAPPEGDFDVELVLHLRPERRFESVNELKHQIARDMAQARITLGSTE